ncbi:MAG: hypothetical protein ABIM88_04465 [candidate division WOR-3 bacterium]
MLAILISLSVPKFFRGLYHEVDSLYAGMFSDTISKAIQRYSLPDSCEETLKKAYFLHLLLQRDGLLRVGYIWMHQRKALMFKRVGDRWVDLDSIDVKGHKIVQKASAVDRIPRLFFGDLFSEDTSPPYLCVWSGNDSELLYSFGWCSELEMAYVVALSWFGIPGRVVFYSEIHTKTALTVAGREFLVDNSFPQDAGFLHEEWFYEKPYPPEIAYSKEVRRLSSWYNKRAAEGISESRFWEIGPVAQARVRKAVRLE